MLDIFSKMDHMAMSTIRDPKIEYIKNKLDAEIKKVKEYYRYRNGKVKNNNMLVRLITTAAPNYHKDIFDYMRLVEDSAIYHSKTFDIVSKLSKGSILDNVIFGYNSQEIFIYDEQDLDLITAESNWEDLQAIKVISYHGTDTSLVMPSEYTSFDISKLTIFKIDIRILLLQYKMWSLNRIVSNFSTDPAEFIYSIVYPSMINDILDISIINRLIHLNNDDEMKPNNNRHPFHILDYNNKIDKILKDVLKEIKHTNKPYSNIMKNIPLLTSKHMYEFVFDNDIGNRQNKWALFISKLDYITFLLEISDIKTLKRNKDTINDLKIIIKYLTRDRALDHIDDPFIKTDIELDVEYILHKIKDA